MYQIYPVTTTPFSIACIYPTYPPTYFIYKDKQLRIEDIVTILAETWPNQYLHNFRDNSCDVLKVLERGSGVYRLDDTTCSAVIFSLFTDIYLSRLFKRAFNYPKLASKEENVWIGGKSFKKNEYLSHFIITYTGMVFFSHHKWNSTDKSFISALPPYAQTVKNISEATLFISQPYKRHNYNFRSVNITQRVNVSLDGGAGQVAAVGVELRVELVRERLLGGNVDDDFDRFLIDENAEILMGYNHYKSHVKDPNDNGDKSGHLGEHYPFLLKQLIDQRIYTVVNYTECINECKEPAGEANHHEASSASNFKPILYNLIAAFINFITNLKLIFYFDYFLSDVTVEANHVVKEKVVECCRMFNLYQRDFLLQPNEYPVKGFGLNGCESVYRVSYIRDTNLLLIVDTKPGCKPFSEQMTPYRGTRVHHYQGCSDEDDHELSQADHDSMIASHYYRSSKKCIVSKDDEGICSYFKLLRADLLLILFAVVKVLLWR